MVLIAVVTKRKLIGGNKEGAENNLESTPKSKIPLNPLKGTLHSLLIFNDFPFRG